MIYWISMAFLGGLLVGAILAFLWLGWGAASEEFTP